MRTPLRGVLKVKIHKLDKDKPLFEQIRALVSAACLGARTKASNYGFAFNAKFDAFRTVWGFLTVSIDAWTLHE